jgi:CheY-like chemotaxis protein
LKEIMDWLRQVEQLACDVYQEASDYFSQDKPFSSFLSRLAEDESLHFHLMGSAAQYFHDTKEHPVSAITIDSSTRDHVESPLRHLHNLITTHSITKQVLIHFICKVEFSELNHIFLYVINTFQQYSRTFQYVAATIQAHKDRIEKFLGDLPDDLDVLGDISKLPRVWKERILIVEDDTPIRELLAKVLSDLGAVETATNGQDAMNKVKHHFFNVVISDIDMPVMGGLEFYQRAVEMDPDIGHHFLFCSGNDTFEIEAFCRERGLVFLRKPFKLKELYKAVRDIADKTL